MNDIALTSRQFYLYVIIGGAIIGALLGLVPLLLGRRRNKTRLGFYALVASAAAGAFAPLLSVVVAAVFSWVIVKGRPVEPAPKTDAEDKDLSSE